MLDLDFRVVMRQSDPYDALFQWQVQRAGRLEGVILPVPNMNARSGECGCYRLRRVRVVPEGYGGHALCNPVWIGHAIYLGARNAAQTIYEAIGEDGPRTRPR